MKQVGTGHAVAHVVRCRPVPVEAWVQLLTSPCGFYGGQSGAGIHFY